MSRNLHMKNVLLIAGIVGLISGTAFGHGGHGAIEGTSLLHYLAEPVHGLFVLALIALVVWLPERRMLARRIRE